MPPSPTTNPVVEIIASGIASAQGSVSKNIKNVFHYMRTAGTVTPNPVNVESQFQTNVMIPLTNALNVTYTQTNNSVRVINDVTNAAIFVNRALPGAISGDAMPKANTAYILMRTVYRGKSFRGNKKFGPLSESDTTGGAADVLNAACLVRIGLIATGMLVNFTDSDGNTWTQVVLSKSLSMLKKNPTSIIVSPVSSILLNKRIGRLDRRQPASQY